MKLTRFPFSVLLGGMFGAAGLAQAQTPSPPGSAQVAPAAGVVAGVAQLPDGSVLTCAGTSLRQWARAEVGKAGEVRREIKLSEPCRSLRVSSSGQAALTTGRLSATVWDLSTGQSRGTVYVPSPERRVAFAGDTALLLGGPQGIERYDLPTRQRTVLRKAAVTGLAASPDGRRLVVSDGQSVQLLASDDLRVLSGIRCEEACSLGEVQFSLDGRGAAAFAGRTLYSLREGRPVNIVIRRSDPVQAFPLRDGGIWVVSGNQIERRDAQTGRREGILLEQATPLGPATWTKSGGLLLVGSQGERLELDREGQVVQPPPAVGSAPAKP